MRKAAKYIAALNCSGIGGYSRMSRADQSTREATEEASEVVLGGTSRSEFGHKPSGPLPSSMLMYIHE